MLAACLLLALAQLAKGTFDPAFCGFAKNCVVKPEGCLANGLSTCQHGVAFRYLDDVTLEIELFWNAAFVGNQYMAVAFSSGCGGGPCMANTAVTECSQFEGGFVTPRLSYNDATPTNTRLSNAASLANILIRDFQSSAENGQIYCRVQQTVIGVRRLLDGVPNADKVFAGDKTTTYMALNAVGLTNGTGLTHHSSALLSAQSYTLFGDIVPVSVAPPTNETPLDKCSMCTTVTNIAIHHYQNGQPTAAELKARLITECQLLGDREGASYGQQCAQFVIANAEKIYLVRCDPNALLYLQDLERKQYSPYNTCKDLAACN